MTMINFAENAIFSLSLTFSLRFLHKCKSGLFLSRVKGINIHVGIQKSVEQCHLLYSAILVSMKGDIEKFLSPTCKNSPKETFNENDRRINRTRDAFPLSISLSVALSR